MHLQTVGVQLRQVLSHARVAVLLKDFLKVHKDSPGEFVKQEMEAAAHGSINQPIFLGYVSNMTGDLSPSKLTKKTPSTVHLL